MKKKEYQKPMMEVVKLQHRSHILVGSDPVQSKSASFDSYEDGEFDWKK